MILKNTCETAIEFVVKVIMNIYLVYCPDGLGTSVRICKLRHLYFYKLNVNHLFFHN